MAYLSTSIQLIEAQEGDLDKIENMTALYMYELSRECGRSSQRWALPEAGIYDSIDVKNYLHEKDRKAFLIKAFNEVAGFILINQVCQKQLSDWNVAEFFILARYQKHGIGKMAAFALWDRFHGNWEVAVHPENSSGLGFWRKVVSSYTDGIFYETLEKVTYDQDVPKRHIFSFLSSALSSS